MADTDNRAQYTEDAVGANHPTLTDVQNRIVTAYHDNSGRHLFKGGSTVASASTITVPDNENYFTVSGSVTISAINAKSTNAIIIIRFTGSPTLTHNATTFRMPGGVDLVVSAGDIVTIHEYSSGNWEVISVVQAPVSPYRNRIINGGMAVDRRNNGASTAVSDDTYCFDRHYILTQTASVNVSQQTNQEDGNHWNIRLTQNQAAAQRMGLAHIIEDTECEDLRGQKVVHSARVRISNSQTIRYAFCEWTGTENVVTSDIVLDWTNATFTAGNFFLAANLTITAVGTTTPSANTWTDISHTSSLGSSGNNIVLFVWTEGTAAQNVTLDIAKWDLREGSTLPAFEYENIEATISKCQRYLPLFRSQSTADWVCTGNLNSTSVGILYYTFKVPPRIPPTGLTYSAVGDFTLNQGGGVNSVATAIAFSAASLELCRFTVTGTGTPYTTGLGGALMANSATAYLIFTGAEL